MLAAGSSGSWPELLKRGTGEAGRTKGASVRAAPA